jgi:hypothetical protein
MAKTPKRRYVGREGKLTEKHSNEMAFPEEGPLREYFHGDEHVTATSDSGNATARGYSLEAPRIATFVAESANGPRLAHLKIPWT